MTDWPKTEADLGMPDLPPRYHLRWNNTAAIMWAIFAGTVIAGSAVIAGALVQPERTAWESATECRVNACEVWL